VTTENGTKMRYEIIICN